VAEFSCFLIYSIQIYPAFALERSLVDDIASIDTDACLGCGSCVRICPAGSLSMQRQSDKKPEIGDRTIGLGSSEFVITKD
jgi:Fe-S-cluster-containing hydrogenase component 2